jgi:hypothetical protein
LNDKPLIKVKATTAAEICARFDLKAEAKPLLRDGMPPRDFIEALVVNKQYVSGIDFVAHALPPREAVWWGCLCLQHACGDSLSAQEKAACRTAVRWIFEPTDDLPAVAHARAVKLASIKADPATRAEMQRLFVELGAGIAEGRFM